MKGNATPMRPPNQQWQAWSGDRLIFEVVMGTSAGVCGGVQQSPAHRKGRQMRVLLTVLLAAVLAGATPPAGVARSPQDDPGFEQLASLITQKMTEYGIPGVAFGVLKDGRMAVRGFGVTNI